LRTRRVRTGEEDVLAQHRRDRGRERRGGERRRGASRPEPTGRSAEPALRLAVDRLLVEAPGESVSGESDAAGGAR
jgi:hypothetical protein